MYIRSIITYCLLVSVGAINLATAEPESMSIAAYEAYLDSMKVEIEEEVSKQFAEEEKELELLSSPLNKGDKVRVRYERGPRMLAVEGTFRDLNINSNPPYVQIGDQRIYFNDVIEIDRKRLYWGALPEAQRGPLKVEIDRRRQQLEDRKERVRRVKRNTELDRAGYTREFFARTIRLNGQFHYKRALGDETMDLIVEIDEANPLARAAIINRTNTHSAITVYLGGNPVSTNLPAEFGVEFPELVWNSHVFWLFRSNLGVNNPEDIRNTTDIASQISSDIRLHVMRKGTGSWWLKPSATPVERPRPRSTNRAVCPECYGAQVVKVAQGAVSARSSQTVPGAPDGETNMPAGEERFAMPDAIPDKSLDERVDDVGAALDAQETAGDGKHNMMTCPRCLGQGTILEDENHLVTTYSYRLELIEQNLVDYSAALAGKYSRVSQQSTAYQQEINELVEAVKKEARDDRLQNAASIQAREAERRRKEQEARELREKMTALMEKYLWLTPDEAKGELPRTFDNYRSLYRFDNPDYPSKMSSQDGKMEIEIQKLTDWNSPRELLQVNDREHGLRLFGLRYRLLQGEQEDGAPRFFIQYAMDVDLTSSRESRQLDLEVNYKLNNNEVVTSKGSYRLPPMAIMQVLGTSELESRAVAQGIADVSVEHAIQ